MQSVNRSLYDNHIQQDQPYTNYLGELYEYTFSKNFHLGPPTLFQGMVLLPKQFNCFKSTQIRILNHLIITPFGMKVYLIFFSIPIPSSITLFLLFLNSHAEHSNPLYLLLHCTARTRYQLLQALIL